MAFLAFLEFLVDLLAGFGLGDGLGLKHLAELVLFGDAGENPLALELGFEGGELHGVSIATSS